MWAGARTILYRGGQPRRLPTPTPRTPLGAGVGRWVAVIGRRGGGCGLRPRQVLLRRRGPAERPGEGVLGRFRDPVRAGRKAEQAAQHLPAAGPPFGGGAPRQPCRLP